MPLTLSPLEATKSAQLPSTSHVGSGSTHRKDMTSFPSTISVCFDRGLAYWPPILAIRTTGSFMPQMRMRLIDSSKDSRCSIFSLVQ